jgi:putative tryptophan/tyrosine transport system substrate-binding protein
MTRSRFSPHKKTNSRADDISILKRCGHNRAVLKESGLSCGEGMRRREFIACLTGAAAAWPLPTQAHQAMPVIGFLHQGSPPPPSLTAAFRKGLVEVGISDGGSITIENRWANGQYDQLPALAADLVGRPVTVIAADFLPAALAAKAATQTIPIVFLSGSDPIGSGLVSSINRPTGNVTGIAFMFTRLGAKNLELLRELAPKATVVAALANPSNPNAEPQLKDLQAAARTLGLQLVTISASNDAEIDSVFPTLPQRQIGALIITADGYLISRQDQLVTLANHYAMPTIYPLRQYAEAGGLMSYGANLPDAFRQCGIYVGKILKGAKPADLPVLQPLTYELVINLKTAKKLGLSVPPTLQALADEVIE